MAAKIHRHPAGHGLPPGNGRATAAEILAAHGVSAQRVFYLDEPPSAAEITRVLVLLGTKDPRALTLGS